MARKITVEVVGDTSSFEKSLKRSARATTKFEHDLSKMGRGVAAGSGLFHGLGRSIAFASGGFIAFESATAFLRKSVDAAREAEVAQRSLAAQMKASGESFKNNRELIERASVSYAKFGFDNEEVVQAITVLDRATGNVAQSLGLIPLAADLARAKGLDLAAAGTVIAKVFGGQETALRRAVPGLEKSAHGYDLIREAQRKLAGQAAANTTQAERFQAALHNTQEIIGTALLPVLNKYLGQLTKWLSNAENQKKLQQDMTAIAGALATAFDLLATSIGKVTGAWDKLPDFGKKQGLLEMLDKLPGRGGRRGLLEMLGLRGGRGKIGDFGKDGLIAGTAAGGDFAAGLAKGAEKAAKARPRPVTLQGRFNLAELKLAQAELTKTMADDRRILVVEKAITEQQIAHVKSLKDKTALTKQLVGITDQIKTIDEQNADALKQQAENVKQRNEAARELQQQRFQGRLDWLQLGSRRPAPPRGSRTTSRRPKR
jgi:hypothetical protein